MTSTFDLLTSESNQFIFVHKSNTSSMPDMEKWMTLWTTAATEMSIYARRSDLEETPDDEYSLHVPDCHHEE